MRSLLLTSLFLSLLAFSASGAKADLESPGNQLGNEVQPLIGEDVVKGIINCVQEILRKGDAEWNLPSFSPLEIHEATLNLDDLNFFGIEGQAVTNLSLSGLPDWDLDVIKIKPTLFPPGAKIELVLNWRTEGNVKGEYVSDLHIFTHTIVGKGKIDGSLESLKLELNAKASALPSIKIKEVKLKPTVGETSLRIENLVIDGVNVTDGIDELVKLIPVLSEVLSGPLDSIINAIGLPLVNYVLENGNIVDNPLIKKCLTTINDL